MLIDVVRKDYRDAVVEDHRLGSLIDTKKIVAFRRSGGWAIVGLDPVRKEERLFSGQERRKVVRGADFFMR